MVLNSPCCWKEAAGWATTCKRKQCPTESLCLVWEQSHTCPRGCLVCCRCSENCETAAANEFGFSLAKIQSLVRIFLRSGWKKTNSIVSLGIFRLVGSLTRQEPLGNALSCYLDTHPMFLFQAQGLLQAIQSPNGFLMPTISLLINISINLTICLAFHGEWATAVSPQGSTAGPCSMDCRGCLHSLQSVSVQYLCKVPLRFSFCSLLWCGSGRMVAESILHLMHCGQLCVSPVLDTRCTDQICPEGSSPCPGINLTPYWNREISAKGFWWYPKEIPLWDKFKKSLL